jgi:DNA-binding NarL/FixJ family response regulator
MDAAHGTGGRIGVLIADDDELYLQTLAVLLEEGGPIEIVGRARNGAEAVTLAHELRPDAVVMDVQMPALDGLEATRRIREELDGISVVVVSGAESETYADDARKLGARAFFSKSEAAESLIAALVGPPVEEVGTCFA